MNCLRASPVSFLSCASALHSVIRCVWDDGALFSSAEATPTASRIETSATSDACMVFSLRGCYGDRGSVVASGHDHARTLMPINDQRQCRDFDTVRPKLASGAR